jgi:hypothetical protein
VRAFVLEFGAAYVVAEDQPAALAKAEAMRAAGKATGVVPGVPRARPVTDRELASLPQLQAAVDAATKPKWGPGASIAERRQLLGVLVEANSGSVDVAQDVVASIESALGYVPSAVARSLRSRVLDRATRPDAGAA